MSVATADLLSAAQRIFDTGSCEADWRNTCSRSYYAIYHDLKAFADSLAAAAYPGDTSSAKLGMHNRLYTGLKNPTCPASDPRRKLSFKLGVMAQNLHSARIKADYEPTESIDQIEAKVNLTTAQNIPALIAGQQVGTPLPKFAGSAAASNAIAPSVTPATQPAAPARPVTPASSQQKKSGPGSLKIVK
ncbi:hypothetical protein [Burkholderia cepacia]|uniref:hypothetical protein n=1 Tax=Burkholderia cepacia TaxID=292 RepID=UPI0039A4978A